MYSKLISETTKQSIIPFTNKSHHVEQLQTIKKSLNNVKSQLDSKTDDEPFMKAWKESDPFKSERFVIKKLIQSEHDISKAWMKCFEIITHFNLIPDKENLTFFDNASFPGSFIMAIEHYIKTRSSIKNYKWYASSLLSDQKNDTNTLYTLSSKHALEDTYNLYKQFPERWLMDNKHNGDVTNKENQLNFCKRLGGKVDLYTSDLGFDIKSYYNQEAEHIKYNAGQILSGLLTLRKGGNFVTKQYTFFETNTLALLIIISNFFEQVYICKPQTSRDTNSEVYVVGKGFLGGVYLEHPYIILLFEMLDEKSKNFSICPAIKQLYRNLIDAAKHIFVKQETCMKTLIKAINAKLNDNAKTLLNDYQYSYDAIIDNYYRSMRFLPL